MIGSLVVLFGPDHRLGVPSVTSLICVNCAHNPKFAANAHVTMLSPAHATLLSSHPCSLPGATIMTLTARCINAGPLNKPLRTYSRASALLTSLRKRAAALLR
jgi:hypothetical protein